MVLACGGMKKLAIYGISAPHAGSELNQPAQTAFWWIALRDPGFPGNPPECGDTQSNDGKAQVIIRDCGLT